MLFIHRHEGPKPGPCSRAHQGPGLEDTELRSRTSSPTGRRPGHSDRRHSPEVLQPRVPWGRGPPGPTLSWAPGPPPGGSSQKEPCASRAHPLQGLRSSSRRERERPVPGLGHSALMPALHPAQEACCPCCLGSRHPRAQRCQPVKQREAGQRQTAVARAGVRPPWLWLASAE